MASGYHLTVKKYLDQNKIGCSLPEYIQRGWNRIYTLEEKEFIKRPCIIAPDVQIPNSVVRHRLGTTHILMKANIETLRKAFELPDELFMNLSVEHKLPETIDNEEKLSFKWDDDDDAHDTKRKKSAVNIIINKKREKRRKYEEYKYDYDSLEPLSLDEIIEEIRTNIGKDLKNEDIKLITELMQIISRHKNDQIMNIYDELTSIQLISQFGGVPKLIQALQEIQKAFEQVAMKTNVASIETVIDVLLENDNTYRVAVELLNSFNENTKKTKQQQKFNLNDKSGDISDHDYTVFNILIKDRISRLPASDLTILIHDLETIRNIDTSKVSNDRDDQVRFLSEQFNIIFTRAHLDGIKMALHAMKSSVSISLKEFIDKIENSLKIKLTGPDNITIESYIHDHLTSLNENELKIIYERLAQQGTLKRLSGFDELNQSITMGLMKKIDTEGLGVVIENMKEAHLDVDSMNELIQTLTCVNDHMQTQSSVSLEQIQNQLGMGYFIESRNLKQQDIRELSKAVDLYSIAHIPLREEATKEECSTFLENLKAPFIRICTERILNLINQENTINLDTVSNKFYNECITDAFNELIHGSDELNRKLLFQQIKEQLKKNKELPDKLYRQMLKEKLIHIDTKLKIDTDKKKISMIIDEINRILNDGEDQIKQGQLIELFDRTNITVPERIKQWYKKKANIQNLQFASSKVKKDMIKRKINANAEIKISHYKTKSVIPSVSPSTRRTTDKLQRITQRTKDQLPTTTTATSSKDGSKQNGSLLKSRRKAQPIVQDEKKQSKTLPKMKKNDDTSVDKKEKEKMKANSQISLVSKSKDQQKKSLLPSTVTPTAAFTISDVSKQQVENEDHFIDHSTKETTEHIDPLVPQWAQIQERDNQKLSNHPPSNTMHAIIESSQQQPEDLHEEYFEKNDKSSDLTRMDMFQVELETIRSETTTDGKMGNNQTLNFELNHASACFLYHLPLPSDPERKLNIRLSGKTAEFINDSLYEKTKAQRILAKPISTNTGHQYIEEDTIGTNSSSTTLLISNTETSSIPTTTEQLSGPPADESSTKIPRRTLKKSIKQSEDIYRNSLTKALNNLFTQSAYDSIKLRKIHDELISSGHISPLNEFYRSTNEALRVTLDHCVTYEELIKWTLSLLQTNNKPNLIDFGHDLYSIAIDLDLSSTDRIDNTRCALEIQENLKHQLQTITETDLREINSYINAAQLEKVVNTSKKLNVTSKDRMISDLNSFLLHLIQSCHTFESKYRPMQTYIREISETFKSRAVANLARKIDEIEKDLSKTFSITFFGVSQRLNDARFKLIK